MTEPTATEPTAPETDRRPGIVGAPAANGGAKPQSALANGPQSDLRTKVLDVIEIIRPIIQSDHGDIALSHVNESEGIVSVELAGACTSCPASTQTLKAGVERIMKDRVPGITKVINVSDGQYEGTPVSL